MKLIFLKSIVCLTSALFSMAHAVEVETVRGAAQVPEQVNSLAVYDIAALDSLKALGIQPKGVIKDVYVDYLADMSKKAKVHIGTIKDPDLEALNGMSPDLVVIGGRMAPNYDVLSKVAPTLDMTMNGKAAFRQGFDRIATYGKIFKKEEEAAILIANLENALKQAQEAVKGKGNALMIMVNGPKIASFGAESRFGYLFNEIGIEPADLNKNDATHGQPVSFEFIQKLNPDWVIVMDRTSAINAKGENAKVVLDNALLKNTTAFSKNQVIYLDSSSYLSSGGYQQLMTELELLTQAFKGS
ncbi:siderophore ABC transporter substrate-binding protein [Advenella sp. WQ 585]|uniref:Siderophore ABC transporter substrate-binding protein n=1 Tax=Advenella mandrilli TaxID=2800330 RepID=A0ABS1EFZ7_9BURK|nr:siderophore ABC transporter substrate-binding protein [Advenella mandrilli]MBK1781135.1 siderophore ABC transporter substrate-binding protein [Advenella mandrilli]